MEVEVVPLPRDLRSTELPGQSVVVFDVLRATTTMTAALDAGVKEIHVFGDLDAARTACAAFTGPRLLCGEQKCLRPPGFDLGNSPGAFTREISAGKVAFMSTTNGTRAILAARGAASMFAGALTNASAVAAALVEAGRPVTLLCAGTDGAIAMEDLIGAGAVLTALERTVPIVTHGDSAPITRRLFQSARNDLSDALREGQGGKNVIAARLEEDILFASRLDSTATVGVVTDDPPVIRRRSRAIA